MAPQELMREVARLESINDQLSSELDHVDHLMRLLGFAEGLQTVKATADEIITNGYDLDDTDFDEEEIDDGVH